MFASAAAALVAGPLIGSFFLRRESEYRVDKDLEALLARMQRRVYPETLSVLASFWLKTVCARGHGLRAWKELSRHLEGILRGPLEDDRRTAITDINSWIHEKVISTATSKAMRPPAVACH